MVKRYKKKSNKILKLPSFELDKIKLYDKCERILILDGRNKSHGYTNDKPESSIDHLERMLNYYDLLFGNMIYYFESLKLIDEIKIVKTFLQVGIDTPNSEALVFIYDVNIHFKNGYISNLRVCSKDEYNNINTSLSFYTEDENSLTESVADFDFKNLKLFPMGKTINITDESKLNLEERYILHSLNNIGLKWFIHLRDISKLEKIDEKENKD